MQTQDISINNQSEFISESNQFESDSNLQAVEEFKMPSPLDSNQV